MCTRSLLPTPTQDLKDEALVARFDPANKKFPAPGAPRNRALLMGATLQWNESKEKVRGREYFGPSFLSGGHPPMYDSDGGSE